MKHITVSTTDTSLLCQVSVEGDVADWIELETDSFTLEGGRYRLPVRVTVPNAMPNGVYTGRMRIRVVSTSADVGGTGMNLIPGLSVRVNVNVIGEEGLWFRVLRVAVYNAKEGDPIKTEVTLKNNAAKSINPTVTLTALSHDKRKSYSTLSLSREAVAALSRETITTYVPSMGMEPGLYRMNFRIIYGGDELWDSEEIFYVLDATKSLPVSNKSDSGEPTVIIHGVLEEAVVSIANPVLGEDVEVEADFRNIGEVPLDAMLRVDIIKDGRVVSSQKGASEYLEVGDSTKMGLTYRPAEAGEYTVRVWIEYSGLRTAVREARIIVWTYTKPLFNLNVNFYVIAAPVVAIIIIWLAAYYRQYYRRED